MDKSASTPQGTGDAKRKGFGLLSAVAGLLLALLGNYLFFVAKDTAYKTLPVLLLAICFSVGAIKLGSKKLGILAVVLCLPGAALSLFIIVFFALGFSR
jgi:hypothetical protein